MQTNEQTTTRSCHHCGKVPPSLLRCTQCKSAYYCNRTCQSAAWNPTATTAGHRSVCRRLRKRAEEMAGLPHQVDVNAVANQAWRDLSRHVQSMDRDEAYKQMCLVQDEIQRLQQYCETDRVEPVTESSSVVSRSESSRGSDVAAIHEQPESSVTTATETAVTDALGESDSGKESQCTNRQSTKSISSAQTQIVNGSWLDQGGSCLIEYLPNIKCYLLTLTSCDECIPKSIDELVLDFSLMQNNYEGCGSHSLSFYEIKLFHAVNKNLLLCLVLPTDSTAVERDEIETSYNISIDNNSISVRIQFNDSPDRSSENTILIDELVCTDSMFSSTTTGTNALNHLCCRSCHNPILSNSNATNHSVIQSVLPLPSGYWDEITDYLICYDGQPTVEFASSSTNAIQGAALEDDAILILHRQDLLAEGGGICELNVKGYGEYSSTDNNVESSPLTEANSLPWKDKSLRTDAEKRTIACAVCCSTLGFVSSHDTDTHRFYKHLLSCNVPNDVLGNRNLNENHTCSSFLAREMIRYAESEAIYTFIVETDPYNASSRCILLRMLSWDTLMATASHSDTKLDGGNKAQFHKVLKVIFEETSGQNFNLTSDNPMDWKWGGIDLCCPPLRSKSIRPAEIDNDSSDMNKMMSSISKETKATSVRICLSTGEWCELKHSLVHQSKYFSGAVRDAVIMTKLGVLPGAEQSALLSFLPVVT